VLGIPHNPEVNIPSMVQSPKTSEHQVIRAIGDGFRANFRDLHDLRKGHKFFNKPQAKLWGVNQRLYQAIH